MIDTDSYFTKINNIRTYDLIKNVFLQFLAKSYQVT